MIVIKNLVKKFKQETAVNGVSFQLNQGELVGLVGANGAGKTTIIKTIMGLLRKTSGSIEIFGHDNTTAEAKLHVGYVSEEPMLYDYMTVEEHLQFTAMAYELKDWREKADELLFRFSLTEKKNKLTKELSKGMKQKVSICCTFLIDYSFFLLDEPFLGLDPIAISELKKIIKQKQTEGKTVLVSSHLISLIEELTQRIIILKKGQIIYDGSLEELKKTAKINETNSEELFINLMKNENN
ncbi:MAG: ABC transporter ATP-binding protein [Candidatus Cloacimonetes bacterium]|nr:ABC transporter ATP-binding protein [Candidatus Cloacimonadota bacterium]